MSAASRLAAIVFDKADDPDAPLRALIAQLAAQGVKVAGLVQERADADGEDVRVRDLDTGATLPIMQNLGVDSEGCRVDPAAIAEVSQMLGVARAGRPDLLIVNRFGRLESEGGGLIAEIGAAVANGEAVIVSVPLRYLDAWSAFAGGLDVQLPPDRAALARWWAEAAAASQDA